ncbi:MAG TPA: Fic family protein [Solirubrobacterales bacterium]|nr:Fic family protein [Solirubrobacterales bacterium]
MRVAEAPTAGDLLGKDRLLKALDAPRDPREVASYLHWDKLRRLKPPEGLSSEDWWLKIKIERRSELRPIPLLDSGDDSPLFPAGSPFVYGLPDRVLRSLHRIDQRCAGEVTMDEVVISDQRARERYLVNSLTEEAIRSSQLEGATTSRRVAKELLRSGREPRDRSERMIVNNYRALQFMRNEMGPVLTPDSVLELHRILTDGTLDDPSAAGRLQTAAEDRVAVYDRDGGPMVHRPPHADSLPERMEALCEFANQGDDEEPFIHPVVRAILVHFWLAYDHPFVDGNGRTARILFFWLMRSRGYWLVEYLPISRLLRDAPAQYTRAFLETETDEGDTTYFLLHQLDVIETAMADLDAYLRRKSTELRDVRRALDDVDGLSGRQIVLLTHAIKHPEHEYTFSGHARSHRVTHETARADLGALADRGFLVRHRRGRSYAFRPAPDLPERLKESPA